MHAVRGRSGRWIRGLVFVLAVILAGMIWNGRERFAPVTPGNPAPDYPVYSLLGDTVHLSDYKGSVVVLNIWATWCKPCVREMPALERLHDQLASEGLEVIAVSVDNVPDADEQVRAFGTRYGITFPLLRDPSGDIQTLYSVGALPTTFVIRKDGRIEERLLGAREWDAPEMIARIRKLLES
jgi:peroxiredoxin